MSQCVKFKTNNKIPFPFQFVSNLKLTHTLLVVELGGFLLYAKQYNVFLIIYFSVQIMDDFLLATSLGSGLAKKSLFSTAVLAMR